MSIEEAAKTSTVAGSNETEGEDTAETEVNSFEIAEAAAETAEMRNQPYNAADWMQPAAAWWILAPSSKLSRFYFRIGSRCWFAATTIAVGATVLGQDSHPGYKLLASAVNFCELWDYRFHLTCSREMHTIRPFWVGRLSGREAAQLNTWSIAKWLGIGTLLMLTNLLVPLIYIWRLEENHLSMYFLLFAAGTKILFLPVIVKPHIALTLIIELDVHHLSKWKEYLSKDSLPAYVDLVGIVKTKWRKFLRYHFGIEIVPPLAYMVAMILLLFGMHPHPEVLMVVSAAPLSMAYLWLQVLPLASFNEMVSDWQLSTDDNDTFRILWQKEKDLMFTVWKYRITFRKVRLSIASLAASMVLKQGRQIISLVTNAFDGPGGNDGNVTSTTSLGWES